jgi:ribosomal protein S18 acetylase RimI-like enzyme
MGNIIKLNRGNTNEIAVVDYESEHQMDKANKISKSMMKKEIADRFNSGHELFFGYIDKGKIIGYVTLIPFFPGYKHCELYWVAVSKKYQGKGIGTALVRYIEKYAKENKFRKIFLYTNKKMKKTRRFYEKLNYKKINEFKGYYGYKRNNTAVLYGKEL